MDEQQRKNELAAVVLRQGEIRLAAQLSIALAADGRAMTLAGILFAVSSAFVGLSVAFARVDNLWWLVLGGLLAAAPWIIAASMMVRIAKPTKIQIVGNLPRNWWEDDVESKSLDAALRKESQNYDVALAHNSKVLADNAGARATWPRAARMAQAACQFRGGPHSPMPHTPPASNLSAAGGGFPCG